MEEEILNPEENLFDEVDSREEEELTPAEDRSTDHTYVQEEEQETPNEEEDLLNQDDEEEVEEEQQEEDYRFSILDYLAESGYINIDEGEDLSTLSGDDLDVYIENKMDDAVDNRISEVLAQLPPIVRQLNEYAIAGGDISAFFSQIAMQNSTGIRDNMDLSDPVSQELIVASSLRSQNYPEDYIQSQIEFLKTNNHLQSHATVYYNNYMQQKQAQLNQMAEQQRLAEAQRREAIKASRKAMDDYISNVNDIGGIPVSLRDKQELSDYMTYPAYELEDGTKISALQKDLYYDIMNSPEAALQIALLIKNRGSDGKLNLDFLGRSAATKVAKEVKNTIRRTSRGTPTSTENKYPTYKRKSLADLLD